MTTNQGDVTQPTVISFYEHPNGGKDFRGRTLSSILQWHDRDLEYSHNHIQILFPLPEGSPFNWHAPVIDKATFDAFRSRPELRERLRESFVRILSFYGFKLEERDGDLKVLPAPNFSTASKLWVRPVDHNHLRITRIIRSLRVLGLEGQAEAFFIALEQLRQERKGRISSKSLMYWTRAATRPLYIAPEDHRDEGKGADFLYEFEKKRQERKGGEDVGAKSIGGEQKARTSNGVDVDDKESVSHGVRTKAMDHGNDRGAEEMKGSGEPVGAKRKIDEVETLEGKG
ncbi:MAG: hypothetical protein M1830_000731 [Pleopsidium flavum]|nr:MAG: hypothetical protein M1830_000731 [Pleopsidium flavum]